jgi:hypothetical protein
LTTIEVDQKDAPPAAGLPVDDGVWDLTLGGLLFSLAVTLDQGRMPVLSGRMRFADSSRP